MLTTPSSIKSGRDLRTELTNKLTMAATTFTSVLLFISTLALLSSVQLSEAQTAPPLVNGLAYTHYKSSCPNLESIILNHLRQAFKSNIGLAAGLLRLHFHDCFVQGCDASVLLDGSASGPSEQTAPPNLTLQSAAFKMINELRTLIDKACGRIVSCADVVALAARDSVALSGGPNYKVPLGRRDGLNFASQSTTLASLPAPTSKVTTLLGVLNKIGLDTTDLVTLSGGHSIGRSHCTSFTPRLYPSQDSTMETNFAKNLKRTCPAANTVNTTVLDVRTPNTFDNKYFVNLVNRQGLFTSDQDLFTDARTKAVVARFAGNQSLFFERFGYSMVKMGMVAVLTGNQGEIRANCSARNSKGLWSIVDGDEGESTSF